MIEEQELLSLLERKENLFESDISILNEELNDLVSKSSFLVIGGAGSIGSSVSKEIFSRNPKSLFIIDINENNLTELVRDIRSSYGYITGKFNTAIIDGGSPYLEKLFKQEETFDYVLNFSALKHVRSEKDPLTLMRMIEVNIMNTIYSIELSKKYGVKKYFCVSTDKAANPANMMGASKRIMEFFLKKLSNKQEISSARFANVAFSDGSLLKGFQDRLYKRQPISVPRDVKRFFITPRESGQLCLISALKGNNNEIFFPKEKKDFQLTSFINLLERFIKYNGFEIKECSSEEEARVESNKLIKHGLWPCYFFNSDTTGEKLFEEFYTENEEVDLDSFTSIGIVKNSLEFDDKKLEDFLSFVSNQRKSNQIAKKDIVNEFKNLIENFDYEDKEKYLDNRM